MTSEEARIVAKAIAGADSGCPSCVDDLCGALNEGNLGWTFMLAEDQPAGGDVELAQVDDHHSCAVTIKAN